MGKGYYREARLSKFNFSGTRTQIKDSMNLQRLIDRLSDPDNFDYLDITLRVEIFKHLKELHYESISDLCTTESGITNQSKLNPGPMLNAVNLKFNDIINADMLYHDLQTHGTQARVTAMELKTFTQGVSHYNVRQMRDLERSLSAWQATGAIPYEKNSEDLGVNYAVNDVYDLNCLLNQLQPEMFSGIDLKKLQTLCAVKIARANELFRQLTKPEPERALNGN